MLQVIATKNLFATAKLMEHMSRRLVAAYESRVRSSKAVQIASPAATLSRRGVGSVVAGAGTRCVSGDSGDRSLHYR